MVSPQASGTEAYVSYWLFQFVPDEGNRNVETGGPGALVDWRLTQHKSAVQVGDSVFFWRASGPRSALIGWGTVTGAPFENADESFSRIWVTTSALFDSPISKEELQGHPVLGAVRVFSGQQGTNFRLSVEQAAALVDLLRSRGLPHPEIDLRSLRANLSARIERGASELARIAETIPNSELRDELVSTIQSISGPELSTGSARPEIGARIRNLSKSLMGLEREGQMRTTANVDAVAQQVANDVEQLQGLAGVTITPAAGELKIQPKAPSLKVEKPSAATDDVPAPAPTAPPPPAAAPAPQPVPPPPPPAPVAPQDHWYCAWEKEDLVGIRGHVSNFARYVTHQELVPPRAIGVFGDWGSGKSFFLRALRSEIALYADQSRTARAAGQNTVFCGHVVQIEFNAWHYVESNLWASVAGYVFEQLYSELERSTQAHTGEQELNTLYKSLDLYKEAEAERVELEKEAESLKTTRATMEQEASNKRMTRDQIVHGLLTVGRNAAQAAFERIPEADKAALGRVASTSKIEGAEEAIAEAKQVVEEGHSTFGRVRLAIQSWGAPGIALAATLTLLALIGIPWLVDLAIKDWLPALDPWIAKLGSYVVAGSAALTWLSKKAGGPLKFANKILDILSNAEEDARSGAQAALDALNGEVQALENKIAAADTQISEQQRLIAEARDAIDPRNLGTKLKRFLEERARSKGYEQHLGLITLVRRDFENLSDLMRKHWAQRFEKVPEAVLQADQAIGARKETVPFIERIVLYIDDLDRCPPEKVVEVLQAVHLMLGFPLFVVVVAVDVRWVRESLLKHYPGLLSNAALATKADGQPTAMSAQAQADDYLEKIFQIPFRIPSLDAECAERLVMGLLKSPFLSAANADQTTGLIPTLDLAPKELKLYQPEELAISALSRSIGVSPRRIRRFLDQYLIMRAGMDDGEVELIRSTNQFQVILGLFAVLSGAANVAPQILQELHAVLSQSTGGAPIATGLNAWVEEYAKTRQVEARELQALTNAAQHIDAAQPDKTLLSSVLLQWIPDVARYSFREIRL